MQKLTGADSAHTAAQAQADATAQRQAEALVREGREAARAALAKRDAERYTLGDVLADGRRSWVAVAGCLCVLWNRGATFNVYEIDDAGLLVEVDVFTHYEAAGDAEAAIAAARAWLDDGVVM